MSRPVEKQAEDQSKAEREAKEIAEFKKFMDQTMKESVKIQNEIRRSNAISEANYAAALELMRIKKTKSVYTSEANTAASNPSIPKLLTHHTSSIRKK